MVVDHGVDATDGPRGGIDLVDEIEGGHLVWHGDGKAAIAESARASDGGGKVSGRDIVGDVDERQFEFLEGRIVDSWPHRMVSRESEQGADFETSVDSGHGFRVGPQGHRARFTISVVDDDVVLHGVVVVAGVFARVTQNRGDAAAPWAARLPPRLPCPSPEPRWCGRRWPCPRSG